MFIDLLDGGANCQPPQCISRILKSAFVITVVSKKYLLLITR